MADSNSPFAGGAGALDAGGTQAGAGEGGLLLRVGLSLDYAPRMAGRARDKAAELENGYSPAYSGPAGETPASAALREEATRYELDVSHIAQVETMYNLFVDPANLATKSVAQLREVQHILGFSEVQPGTSEASDGAGSLDDIGGFMLITKTQEKNLKTGLAAKDSKTGKAQIDQYNDAVGMAQRSAGTAKQGVMDAVGALQTAMLGKDLASTAKKKADDVKEVKEIDTQIDDFKAGLEAVSQVLEIAGCVATCGAGEEVEGLAKKTGAGIEGAQAGLALTGLAVDVLFDQEIQKKDSLEKAINDCDAKIEAIKSLATDQAVRNATNAIKTAQRAYSDAMERWRAALSDRKAFFATAGQNADAKGGGANQNDKDQVGQLMVFLSDAKDAQSFLLAGQDACGQAQARIPEELEQVREHRKMGFQEVLGYKDGYILLSEDTHQMILDEGNPDLHGVESCVAMLGTWASDAQRELDLANRVETQILQIKGS